MKGHRITVGKDPIMKTHFFMCECGIKWDHPETEVVVKALRLHREDVAEEGEEYHGDYQEVFGRRPEKWRGPLGALRLTLTGDPDKVDVERAQAEVEDLVRVLNGG